MLRHAPAGATVLCEPGRSLVANAGVTLYTVGTVKEVPGVRTYVAVDGGMSDNIRPMLYGAVYEAEIVDRFGDSTACRIVGMHCESGDVLVPRGRPGGPAARATCWRFPPRAHTVTRWRATTTPCRRPPVVFCRDGDARVVVRRETYEDLTPA